MLLHKPDLKTITALLHIVRSPSGVALVELLGAELQKAQELLVDASADRLPRLQGHAAAIRDLRDLLAAAPEIVAKNTP